MLSCFEINMDVQLVIRKMACNMAAVYKIQSLCILIFCSIISSGHFLLQYHLQYYYPSEILYLVMLQLWIFPVELLMEVAVIFV